MEGYFDYLNEYCKVVYLERTKGISSTQIRNEHSVRLGIVGNEMILDRFINEMKYVSGIEVVGAYASKDDVDSRYKSVQFQQFPQYNTYESLLDKVDAVYINAPLKQRNELIAAALEKGKHVLTEFPFGLNYQKAVEFIKTASEKGLVLMEGLKTAYCPAFGKMISLVKSGRIGKILSIEANFTQILGENLQNQVRIAGGSVASLGAYPLLAIFKLLGYDYKKVEFITHQENGIDTMTRMNFIYDGAIATSLVAINAKAEGSLTISGTKGYVYVPAPWWKTEYYELRYEDINKNSKFFYKFEGEGLRYEIVEFVRCIKETAEINLLLNHDNILAETKILSLFYEKNNVIKF